MNPEPIIVIPARMASSRLPGKPLADIGGAPMIVQVWRRAQEAAVGPVLVACAEREIAEAIGAVGGTAVLTPPDLPSGSDRVYDALTQHDDSHEIVVNLQGDLPTIDPQVLAALAATLAEAPASVDIATLVTEIRSAEELANPNVTKAVVGFVDSNAVGRALYFSRQSVPYGDGPHYHHIGVYAYRREALARFVALPPTPLEQREKLEQLRALEAGMTILARRVDSVPLGVDTPADLAEARRIISMKSDS